MKKIHNILLKFTVYRYIIDATKKIIIPGFNNLPVYTVTVFFIKKLEASELTIFSSYIAFNFFLALFPGIIFLFTLIPYIEIEDINFHVELLNIFKDLLPVSAYQTVEETLVDIINQPRGGLLSIGFISALYFSTNGINAIIESFNKSYHLSETRTFINQRLVAIGLNFILILFLFTAIILIVVGQIVLNQLGETIIKFSTITFYSLVFLRWLIIIALLLFSISILFYYGPSEKKKWRFISAGSTLATILCIITSLVFAYFINNFGQYNKLYGSIGTLIVIMLWIYFNSLVLLIGFELNASTFKDNNIQEVINS